MHSPINAILRTLQLQAHPEGGYFHETFRSEILFDDPGGTTGRTISTAIYFLLRSGTFSAFHRLIGSDEIWHHYDGNPVELHTLTPESGHQVHTLGTDLAAGQRPQIVVRAGTLQAARTVGEGYSLCGCTVSPGFVFEEFEMPGRDDLIQQFPEYADVIRRFTRT